VISLVSVNEFLANSSCPAQFSAVTSNLVVRLLKTSACAQVRQRYFSVLSLKGLFENTENRHIIDFIKETHFSNLL